MRRQTCGATTGWETAVDAALSPSREAVAPGDILKVRWVAAEGDDKVYRMSSWQSVLYAIGCRVPFRPQWVDSRIQQEGNSASDRAMFV
ncbi:MAG: hypothetical protein F4Y80_10965 [Caldilineaceae bacterium SB0665_bin_21]|nr:hypothetical protein [Caldilineaceae bacterium SB0665_bin_21]MYA04744.1 hypothetical protein [Caldilineaceae bacterium SB0664_bin_22]